MKISNDDLSSHKEETVFNPADAMKESLTLRSREEVLDNRNNCWLFQDRRKSTSYDRGLAALLANLPDQLNMPV